MGKKVCFKPLKFQDDRLLWMVWEPFTGPNQTDLRSVYLRFMAV